MCGLLRVTGWVALFVAMPVFGGVAQNVHPEPPPEVRAVRLEGMIALDGRLDEAVWRTAPAASDFRQSEPREGEPATQRTEVRFAYDDDALYVGARMLDELGAAGVQTRLVRRDGNTDADYLQLVFDTYHDHLGRAFFAINPSGVRSDSYAAGGSGDDASWDPVWEAKTTIDSLGWTAELRIPFSQLRYPRQPRQTWGLQVWRQANRLNELSQWSFWGRTEVGGAPRFGHLLDLEITRSPQRAEILPYVVGRSSNLPTGDPDDPFADPHRLDGRIGADAKLLLTSNLTLSATINPDFGQVEVDPAVVNLSAFETFFSEQRPFFVEGSGLFSFGGLNCYFCSNVSSLSMFYTRRIGRLPQGMGNAFDEGPYVDAPDNSTILGAAKVTGRTGSGWSIGMLDAMTKAEEATVQRSDGSSTTVPVEPFTNYFVARVAKDLAGGASQLRGMATSVIRNLDDGPLGRQLASHSEAIGFSTDTWWGRRDYRLMTQIAMSQVSGDSAAVLRLQRSSARYFQRPDREHGGNGLFTDRLDASLTAMRGWAAYARFAKESGNWNFELSTNIRSPGFENNDIAFLTRADYIWMSGNVLRNFTRPNKLFRQMFFIAGGQQQYNFDGDLTDRQVQLWGQVQPHNYWNVSAFWIHGFPLLDDRLTRGGPVVGRYGFNYYQLNVSTDQRKAVVLGTGPSAACNLEDACQYAVNLNLTYRPASNVSISVGPSYGYNESKAQFVTALDDSTATAFGGRRYVFSDLFQRSWSMNTRLNVTFTPALSLELFAQPFIASGEYARLKEFAAPRSREKLVYGQDIGTLARRPGDPAVFVADPDGAGPAESFEVEDPSFTVRSLRGNAVLRWEYQPGSTIFLVWALNRSDALHVGRLDLTRDARGVFDGPTEHILLIKVNYWLGF